MQNKNTSVSKLALQQSEDNKKEIINIYAQLKKLKNNNSNNDNTQNNSNTQTELNSIDKTYVNYAGGFINQGTFSTTAQQIGKVLEFYATQSGLVKFELDLKIESLYSSYAKNNIAFFLNDNPISNQNILTRQSNSATGNQARLVVYAHVNQGFNTFYANFKCLSSSHNPSLREFYLTTTSAFNLYFITNINNYQFITNGTQYAFINGLSVSFIKIFDTKDDLLALDYQNDWNSGTYSTSELADANAVYMPKLNEETGEYEKGDFYYTTTTNAVCLYNSSKTMINNYSGMLQKYNDYAVSEYYNDSLSGIVLFYVGSNNRICLPVYKSTGSISYQYLLNQPKTLYDIVTYDCIKTITNKPMKNMQFIAYTKDCKGYFIDIDCSGTLPAIDPDKIFEINQNSFLSHTYFHNNKYYCFYKKDTFSVFRKVFTYDGTSINVESDQLFSYCEEVLVIDETHTIEVKNTYPFFVEKCFYE